MGRLTTRQLASKRKQQKSPQRTGNLQPGAMLQDRYQIVGPLGSGGFSSVYQARDMRFPNVTKLCAIKEMSISTPDPQMRELTIKSFEREANLLAMLNHPAIPDVSDYFTEGDRSYLVMELIRGKDLDNWLEETDEVLEQDKAIDWAVQVCEALKHLHNQTPQPIVFRDVKPSNIMLDQYGRIRLIDFNIAKLFETGDKGTMIGTEGYSPPEQYRGQAEPAGDIYALGATLHHLLTRKDPRLEPPFTFAERPINKYNPHVSPAFEALVMRCLAYDPKDRYESAEALIEALKMLHSSSKPISEPASVTAGSGPAPVVNTPPGVTPTVQGTAPATEEAEGDTVTPLWQFRCEDEIRRRAAVSDDLVLVSAYDNNVYAVSAGTGEFVWKFPAEDSVGGSSPVVYEDSVFIGSADHHLYSIQLRTGRQNWRFKTEGPIYSTPTVYYDHVFFGSDDGMFYALNTAHGRPVWKANAYSPVRSTAVVDDERVIFGTEDGFVYCLELASGKIKWRAQAKRGVTSSPLVYDEIVFFGSLDTIIYALDASSGYVIWRFRSSRPIISSPARRKDTIFIGSSDGKLYALDTNSGRNLWSFETEGQIASSPAVHDDAVFFGSTDGFIYRLGYKKGDLQWKYDTGAPVISSPTIVDGILYIGGTNHILYAFTA